MLVNGPPAQVAPAGQGDFRPAEAAEQCAHQVVAGSNFSGQFVGNLAVADVGTVNLYGGAVDSADTRPQFLEDLENHGHIADLRNIFNAAYSIHQQGGRDNGDSGILSPADLDGSVEGISSVNQILGQIPAPSLSMSWNL